MPYPVICSWCGDTYKYKEIENSNGICPPCAAKEYAKLGITITEEEIREKIRKEDR